MAAERGDILATWKVTVKDHSQNPDGVIVQEYEKHNLIVNEGRHDALGDLFVSSFTRELFPYLGVGSFGPTAPVVGDLGLGRELTSADDGTYTARNLCTNNSAGALSISDVQADNTVSPYQEKIILQAVFPTTGTGALNGTTFYEFGLFDTSTLPTEHTATNNPAAGSSVLINMASTTGFSVSDTLIIESGTTYETFVVSAVNPGVSITATTLANSYTTPTVTKPSGRMFNHYVLSSGAQIAKTSSLSVTVQVTIRM